MSVFSLKKKDEPLLPQTMETTVEGLTDQGKSETEKTKVSNTTTKTKMKKFLGCFLDGATSVLFMVLSVFSLKKKDEPLLPQTMKTTMEGLTDQGKSEKEKAKVSTTTTKTKKKNLDGATSVPFEVKLMLLMVWNMVCFGILFILCKIF